MYQIVLLPLTHNEYLIVRSVTMIHVESHGALHVRVKPGKRAILAQLNGNLSN